MILRRQDGRKGRGEHIPNAVLVLSRRTGRRYVRLKHQKLIKYHTNGSDAAPCTLLILHLSLRCDGLGVNSGS